MEFKKDALLKAGVLDYATNFAGEIYDQSDKAGSIAAIESLSFSSVGYFKEFSINHTQENEKIIETDFCGAGELDRTVTLTPTVTFTWQVVNKIDVFASFLGLTVEDVAGVSTPITTEALGTGVDKWDIVFLANKNGDNTVVSSIIIDADGTPLVADTDYVISVDDGSLNKKGYTYITFLTVQTGVLDADYNYTPSVSKLTGYNVESLSLPSHALRFTTCANDEGKSDVYYLTQAKVSDSIAMDFVNTDTTDFAGASVSFVVTKWGSYFEDKKSI